MGCTVREAYSTKHERCLKITGDNTFIGRSSPVANRSILGRDAWFYIKMYHLQGVNLELDEEAGEVCIGEIKEAMTYMGDVEFFCLLIPRLNPVTVRFLQMEVEADPEHTE
eukprot:Trichotokara_eunicae@DN11104_c0_g1_i1.p1